MCRWMIFYGSILAHFHAAVSTQKRMIIIDKIHKDTVSYNLPFAFLCEGDINLDKLKQSIYSLVYRHESLRTSFEYQDNRLLQIIHKDIHIDIAYFEANEDKIDDIIETFVRPFKLSDAPLLRLGYVKLTQRKHVLIFDMHHTIADGISACVFTDELGRLYNNQCLPDLKIQYKDYAEWQWNSMIAGGFKGQEAYWMNVYTGELPIMNMPTDYVRPHKQSFEGERLYLELDGQITKNLKQLAKQAECTMYMLMMAFYNILLSKYTGQRDIVVGSPAAGRTHADLQNMIGMFVNTIAIRNNLESYRTERYLLCV